LSDDESLPSLLEVPELLAHIHQDTVLDLVQARLSLQDGFVFFREFVSFSTQSNTSQLIAMPALAVFFGRISKFRNVR
jgi:hypothetical protein